MRMSTLSSCRRRASGVKLAAFVGRSESQVPVDKTRRFVHEQSVNIDRKESGLHRAA
ncbi:Hypothetical predicted protein [Xyrichtys novacula]|uniref:Uncharacterized protein n=1 Tax=Xyrichtys novacula TaxID=13765 RepID=A0AAV1GIH2_XYRNO|nr:Hypothetical predicted protein [Xyrichtys novacula]